MIALSCERSHGSFPISPFAIRRWQSHPMSVLPALCVPTKVEHEGPVAHVEMQYKAGLIVMLAPDGAFGGMARAAKSRGLEAPQTFFL